MDCGSASAPSCTPPRHAAVPGNSVTVTVVLDRASQVRRVRADEIIRDELLFAEVVIEAAPQPSDVLTAWAVPVWLQGIQLSRLPAAKRPPILAFKREAANVLYQHFSRRAVTALPVPSAVVPASAADVQQVAQLTAQIGELTDVVNLLQEHLAGLLRLPEQVQDLSQQVGQAIIMLDALADRQETTETQVARIDERTQRLTPAHARAIQELVDRLVRETQRLPVPLTYATIYGRLKHRFRAGSYREIADERYDEVIAYLRDALRHATSGETPEQGSMF